MECELSLALVKSMKRGWPPNAIESFLFQKRIDILVVLKQLAAHHGHLVIQMRRKQVRGADLL